MIHGHGWGQAGGDAGLDWCSTGAMAFGLWIDESLGLAWVQGTHEYRPLGAAAVALTDQFLRVTSEGPLGIPGISKIGLWDCSHRLKR